MFRILLLVWFSCALGFTPSRKGSSPVFLICPGFGNDEIDYRNPLGRGEEVSFVSALGRRGIDAEVVAIKRLDWLRLLGPSITQPVRFARNEMTAAILYKFYVDQVRAQLTALEAQGRSVVLVGHSAGGWLVRELMTEADNVLGLVSLGTPHYPAQVNDATRGALRNCNEVCPGPFKNGKFYVSVAGTAVKANAAAKRGDMAYFANDAYLAVSGRVAETGMVGDGVVPLDFALLEGSKQVVLNCYHSIQAPDDMWYGGEGVVDTWLPKVRRELASSSITSGGGGSSVSIVRDGLGPWADSVLGKDVMRLVGILSVTPYVAFIVKAVAAGLAAR